MIVGLEAVVSASSLVFHWRRIGEERAICGAPYGRPMTLYPVSEAYDPSFYTDECRRCSRILKA